MKDSPRVAAQGEHCTRTLEVPAMSIITRMRARHAQRAAERRMIEDAYAAFDQQGSRLDRFDMTQEACERLLLAVYEEECADAELPVTIYRKRHPRRMV